ncbi:hypothetical protein HON22_04600 [Candidatus Peregrinibacteria bacterium]|jgi:hypothetical protein|nr:hypothetical protein [Candidatus Peregrinibacteria bacterium]
MINKKNRFRALNKQVQVEGFLYDVKSLLDSGSIDRKKAELLLNSVKSS